MSDALFPKHYEEWKKCITEKCKIEMNLNYVNGRLKILQDDKHDETVKFRDLYGNHWLKQIISYFEEAKIIFFKST
ncbi:MAG: hypothetical protein HOP07_13395 [Bacteriovoracaceae bacterium]|nr:hypothetical protein [Bacteriovoracaceae bacterium]